MGGIVSDLQIQPALGHRSVNALGNTGHIEMEVNSVGVLFCDSQRGMQKQPVQKAAHLAQPAPPAKAGAVHRTEHIHFYRPFPDLRPVQRSKRKMFRRGAMISLSSTFAASLQL